MGDEMVGICVGLLLVRGEGEHDGVSCCEWSSRVEEWNVGFEGQVSDDAFDSLEGYLVWSCIVTGESGDGVHEVEACVVAKVEEDTNEGSVGAFIYLFEFGEFDGSSRDSGGEESFEGGVRAEGDGGGFNVVLFAKITL